MSAVAVIISLVYLALQIRHNTAQISQNTETVRAATELETARLTAEFNAWVAERPDIADLWLKGMTSPDQMSRVEGVRFFSLLMNLFIRMQGLFRQVRRGFLPDDYWDTWDGVMLFYLKRPVVHGWWKARQVPFPFSSEFVQHVDRLIHERIQTPSP